MKKLITLSLILLASTQINAQWWGKSIKGNGNVTEQTRDVGSYDGIVVSGSFNVTLYEGDEGVVKVEAESNLIEYIETVVKNGQLYIGVKKNKNFNISSRKGMHISVPFKDIERIKLSGSGEIVSRDAIETDRIEVTLTGSGDIELNINANETSSTVSGSGEIKLEGTSKTHKTRLTGSGDIYAGNYIAQSVDAQVTGSGDIRVYCKDNLKARVTGSGDIEYVGNPEKRDTKVTGSGDITRD